MPELELSAETVWALRALTQPYNKQAELYPEQVALADELVEDWGEAFDRLCKKHPDDVPPDLKALDALIISKSGQLEYWTDKALRTSSFWEQIRESAKLCLVSRSLSTFAPSSSEKLYIFGP